MSGSQKRQFFINIEIDPDTHSVTNVTPIDFDPREVFTEKPDVTLISSTKDYLPKIAEGTFTPVPVFNPIESQDFIDITNDKILKILGVTKIHVQEFVEVVEKGNIEDIKLLLEFGLKPIGFATAFRKKRYDVCELLLQYGADINEPNGERALIIEAIINKSLEEVKFLVERGANLQVYCNSNTPLLMAVKDNQFEISKCLLEKGVDPNCTSFSTYKIVPLGVAAYEGYENLVELLIEHGADVNKTNGVDQSPMYLAISKGFYKIVKILLEKGANVNGIYRNHHNDHLYQAAFHRNESITKLLLQYGAKLPDTYIDVHVEQFVKKMSDELKQSESTQVETSKNETKQSETKQAETKQIETNQNETKPNDYVETAIPIGNKVYSYKGRICEIPNFIETIKKSNI